MFLNVISSVFIAALRVWNNSTKMASDIAAKLAVTVRSLV